MPGPPASAVKPAPAAASSAVTGLTVLLLIVGLLWHLISIMAPVKPAPPEGTAARDYASYHYAFQAAAQGEHPYDAAALSSLAQAEGTRDAVHPYLYPPPFLLFVAPTAWLDLDTAFLAWRVLQELCLLAACLALVRAWMPLDRMVLPVTALVVGVMYAVRYGVELGQANAMVLALVLGGVALVSTRPRVAGALVGTAAMLKMSPALVLVWWLARKEYPAVIASVVTAVGLTLLSLLLVSPSSQWAFYTAVLPELSAGHYLGLEIRLDMFGNHSIPNLWYQVFSTGDPYRLPLAARVASGVTALAGLAAVAWVWKDRSDEPHAVAAQAAAVLVGMLFVPAYTYEHHLVFAVPALVLSVVAVRRNWLIGLWPWVLGLAVAGLLFPLPALKSYAVRVVGEGTLGFLVLQELKFVALVALFAAMVRLGTGRLPDLGLPLAPPPKAL